MCVSVIGTKSSSSDELVVGTNFIEIEDSPYRTNMTCDCPGTVTSPTEYDTSSATSAR